MCTTGKRLAWLAQIIGEIVGDRVVASGWAWRSYPRPACGGEARTGFAMLGTAGVTGRRRDCWRDDAPAGAGRGSAVKCASS